MTDRIAELQKELNKLMEADNRDYYSITMHTEEGIKEVEFKIKDFSLDNEKKSQLISSSLDLVGLKDRMLNIHETLQDEKIKDKDRFILAYRMSLDVEDAVKTILSIYFDIEDKEKIAVLPNITEMFFILEKDETFSQQFESFGKFNEEAAYMIEKQENDKDKNIRK